MIWQNVIYREKNLLTGFIWLVAVCCCRDCSVGAVLISLLLRGNVLSCMSSQLSKVFLRISGEGFDCLPWDMARYCSYNADSSESSILDVPLTENSGALDAVLVVIIDGEYIGKLVDVGVLRNNDDDDDNGIDSGDESKCDGRVAIDGCWTVSLTRGVNVTGAKDVGIDIEEVLVLDVVVFVFKLHLIT